MIKNERQYKISKANAVRFKNLLDGNPERLEGVDSVIADAAKSAMKSQLAELNLRLKEYRALKSGDMNLVFSQPIEELPRTLIKARIANGLTQKQLAEKLGCKEQQIQRYEEQEYSTTNFSRLVEIAKALDLSIQNHAFFGENENAYSTVFKKLKGIGLPGAFVSRRLIGSIDEAGPSKNFLLGILISNLEKIFGWSANAVLEGNDVLRVSNAPVYSARYKVSKARDEEKVSAYTVYAHYLAMLLVEVLPEVNSKDLPSSAEEFYNNIILEHELVDFETALRYIWSLGIAVLPLKDEGVFDGAYWRIQGRHIIVLKQSNNYTSKWLFDLLHDYFHCTQHHDLTNNSMIELPATSIDRIESPDEFDASEFAGEVQLSGMGSYIWEEAAELTNGKLPRLKSEMQGLSKRNNVDIAALANFMAYRISLQGENWWGAAANLQPKNENPWRTARDVFLENVEIGAFSSSDRDLLISALTEKE